MAKIERKYLAHCINTAKSGEAVYERLTVTLDTVSMMETARKRAGLVFPGDR